MHLTRYVKYVLKDALKPHSNPFINNDSYTTDNLCSKYISIDMYPENDSYNNGLVVVPSFIRYVFEIIVDHYTKNNIEIPKTIKIPVYVDKNNVPIYNNANILFKNIGIEPCLLRKYDVNNTKYIAGQGFITTDGYSIGNILYMLAGLYCFEKDDSSDTKKQLKYCGNSLFISPRLLSESRSINISNYIIKGVIPFYSDLRAFYSNNTYLINGSESWNKYIKICITDDVFDNIIGYIKTPSILKPDLIKQNLLSVIENDNIDFNLNPIIKVCTTTKKS